MMSTAANAGVERFVSLGQLSVLKIFGDQSHLTANYLFESCEIDVKTRLKLLNQ